MDSATQRGYELMLGESLTVQAVDLKKCVIALRSAITDGPETREAVRNMILIRRRRHLIWETLTQRKWQAHPRTLVRQIRRRAMIGDPESRWIPNALDALNTRERYVRCS